MAVAEPARLTLVSGPARSGKSRWAEHLAQVSGRPVIYLATGPRLPEDPAWQERLARHRRRRPACWECREVGGALAAALETLHADQLALVDSLGTWVAAHLDSEDAVWEHSRGGLCAAIEHCPASLVLVSEETGWGVVPPTAVGGLFRDRLGALQQRLMQASDSAWLVLQGRAIDLMAISQAVPTDP
jgi:adenosylcobinamide kinase / adenosylcobinamide-phosphate guanylyltransferase